MLESLTLTGTFGGGTAISASTAHATIGAIANAAENCGEAPPIRNTTKNAVIAGTLTASVSTASTMVRDEIVYSNVLADAYACVESMSDYELEQALIAIGDLEGEIELTDQNVKSI